MSLVYIAFALTELNLTGLRPCPVQLQNHGRKYFAMF